MADLSGAFVINSKGQLFEALEDGYNVIKNTAESTHFLGVSYIYEMLLSARQVYPNCQFTFTIDCANNPALVQKALKQGFTAIALQTNQVTHAKLTAIAAAYDAQHAAPDAQDQKVNQAIYEFLVPIVKGFSTEMSIEVASLGIQVHVCLD